MYLGKEGGLRFPLSPHVSLGLVPAHDTEKKLLSLIIESVVMEPLCYQILNTSDSPRMGHKKKNSNESCRKFIIQQNSAEQHFPLRINPDEIQGQNLILYFYLILFRSKYEEKNF